MDPCSPGAPHSTLSSEMDVDLGLNSVAPQSTLSLEDMNIDSPLSAVPDDDMLPDSTTTPSTGSRGSSSFQRSLGPDVSSDKVQHDLCMAAVAATESDIKLRRSSRSAPFSWPHEKSSHRKQKKQLKQLQPLGSAANPIDLTQTQLRVGDGMVEIINIIDDDV